MSRDFRFEPTTVEAERLIARPRLTGALNGRFTHRVTTIVGAAGYGKTTALALAVENNRLDPLGRDVWLTVVGAEVGDEELIGAVAGALGIEPDDDLDATMERVCDAVWSAAPDDVALIIDDAHRLGEESTALLGVLLAALPTNGHLVLVSRHRLDLHLARLRAHGQLLELAVDDLLLDDDEIGALAQRAGTTSALALPRHAASADLQLAAGLEAGADFVWEEVLSTLDPDRLSVLRRCAVLDDLDDELVEAVSDGDLDCARLFADLPLVERFEGGCRMHPILSDALMRQLRPGEREKTLSIAADCERRRGRLASSALLHHAAGDEISALDVAREFAIAPTLTQSMDDVVAIRRIVNQIDPDSPVGHLLDALTHFDGLENQLGRRLMIAAGSARTTGDLRLETMALYRAAQSQLFHHDRDFWTTHARVAELADVDEMAVSVDAYLSSILDQADGRPADALAHLDRLGGLGRDTELTVRAERLFDLGRPEEVAVGLTGSDVRRLRPGTQAFIGLAIWVRGDSNPAASLVAVTRTIEAMTRARFSHPLASALGIGVIIALAAGENGTARRWVAHSRDVASSVGVEIAEIDLIARAALAAVTDSDEAAAGLLDGGVERATFTGSDLIRWPSRAQLPALALVYLCRPDLRSMLDESDVGPSLRTSRQAGQALVALRHEALVHDGLTLSADLPWHRPNLLRANVLPHHLVELACAAVAGGSEHAAGIIDAIPHAIDHLRRVASGRAGPAGDIAIGLLGSIPRPEPFRLRALLLGPTTLVRDGEIDADSGLTRRPKVREFFALLAERRSIQRQEACALLWPDHDDDERALATLRSTLSNLHDALEPDRERGVNAFHLSVDGDTITLDPRVTTDLEDFEDAITAAQVDDHAGLPAQALNRYRAAATLYRGEYVQGIDAAWAIFGRLRLQTMATGALCRIAELVAARGEPEAAARWAAQARTIDPLHERAGRIFVAALLAAGDRSGARAAAAELVATLDHAGLDLTPDTARLVARLG